MHGFDAFEVPADEVIRSQNILGVIVPDIQKPVILPALRFFRSDAFRNLNVQFFVLPGGNKVNLAVAGFPDVHRIAPTAQLQINHILKTCSNGICIVAQDTVAQRGVGQIEFLLGFQQLLAVQVIPGAAVKQVSLLQLFQIAVYGFVIQRTMLCFQIVGDGLGREGVAHIVEGVLHHPLQLIDFPNLIPPYNVGENRGVINVPDNGVNLVLGVALQMSSGKAAKANVVR